jgi:release factor glutamine methyltransferase
MTPPAPVPMPAEAPDPRGVAAGALVEELAGGSGATEAGGDGGAGVAPHEARFIVEEAIGAAPGGARPAVVPAPAVARARAMAARRAAGEPLQYIFGHWPFRELDLRLDPRVLIPRPETEQVVEVALGEARRLVGLRQGGGLVAVDAGTGSGAIALALASALGAGAVQEIWATELSADALAVAAANVRAGGAPGPAVGRTAAGVPPVPPLPQSPPVQLVQLVQGSWLAPLPARLRGRVDLVVSNPPYVTEEEWAGLEPQVRAEPRQALVAGPSRDGVPGLAEVEAVLQEALVWLARPAAVVVELAPAQADAARALVRQLGYDEGWVEPDLAGRPRALVARRRGLQQGE